MSYKHRIAVIRRFASYLLARDVAPAPVLRRLNLPASTFLAAGAWIDRAEAWN